MENTFLKFDGQGNVDVDASTEAFRTAVSEYAVLQKADLESIASAVDQVFAENANLDTIQLPTLASLACNILKPSATAYQGVKDRVMAYVRNAKEKFEINRGRGGGVSRKVAEPTETPAS